MKLCFSDISNQLLFEENFLNLIVENKDFYIRLRTGLLNAEKGLDVDFVISDEENEYYIHKNALLVNDLFSYDENNKKILGALYAELNSIYKDILFSEAIVEMNKKIIEVSDLLKYKSDFDFTYENDLEKIDLVKILNPRLEVSTNPFEKVIDIIILASKIKNIKLLIFTDLALIFNNDELNKIREEAIIRDINILNIERIESYKNNLQTYIIDDDYCII